MAPPAVSPSEVSVRYSPGSSRRGATAEPVACLERPLRFTIGELRPWQASSLQRQFECAVDHVALVEWTASGCREHEVEAGRLIELPTGLRGALSYMRRLWDR